MEEYIKEVGIGGVFALMILREVFNFIKEKKNGSVSQVGHDDNKHVNYEEFEKHKAVVQYKDNCLEVVKRFDGLFASQEKRFDRIDSQFLEVKTLIKNGNK